MVDGRRDLREEDLRGSHMGEEGSIKEGSMEEEEVEQ